MVNRQQEPQHNGSHTQPLQNVATGQWELVGHMGLLGGPLHTAGFQHTMGRLEEAPKPWPLGLGSTVFFVVVVFFLIFYWIIGFGVHEQSMQDSCVGTYMVVCFLFFSPSPTFGFSPQAIPPHLPLPLALPFSPQ